VHEGTVLLGPRPQIDNPLVEPGCLQRPRSHFGKSTGGVGAAQRAEAMLRSRALVGITGIERRAYSGEKQSREHANRVYYSAVFKVKKEIFA